MVDKSPDSPSQASRKEALSKQADPSVGGENDLGDEDPWRLPSSATASATAPETGTTPLFPRSRARSSRVSGGAELIIPDCLIRLDTDAASGAVSGVIEAKSTSSDDVSAKAERSPIPEVRPYSNSQPTILVEDHELEEVLEEESSSDSSAVVTSGPPPMAASAPPPRPSGAEGESTTGTAWHERFFEQGAGPLVASGGDDEARRDVEFLALCTGLNAEKSVLDLGCGDGRHCFAMMDQGFSVLGVDRSPHQLGMAKERNAKRMRKAEFTAGDFRYLKLDRQFDVVTCLGSSFGYFSEEENLRCLESMREYVKPGGTVVLQSFNRDFVVSKVPCRSWWSDSGYLVLDEVDYHYVSERLRVKRTMLGENGVQTEHLIEIRAYALRELCLLLATAGLQVVEISGSRTTRGYYYGADSPEMWLVARRPA